MKRSWKEKLDEKGVNLVEASAKVRKIKPLANTDFNEIARWFKELRAVLSASPQLEQKRKVKLDPKFARLYLRACRDVELDEEKTRLLLENEEFPLLRAEELEWTERIALALEADQNKRIEAYEALACGMVWLRQMFSGGLKKQLGTKTPRLFELFWAVAQNLEWAAKMFRGNVTETPGRFNVGLAGLVDAILEHQKEPLTQMDLYEALSAAGAQLPEDPEAFRLWLHRARKQGLVKGFHSGRTKTPRV